MEHFGADLPPFSRTWARQLAEHGYQTVCCGKLHHTGQDQMQGWTARPAGDLSVGDWAIDPADAAVFTRRALPTSRSKWSDAKEVRRAGIGEGPYQTADVRWTQAATDAINRHFIDPFYDRPASPRPLALKVSLIQPHYPYFTDAAKFRYYLNRVRSFVNEPRFDHPFLSTRHVEVGKDVTERDLIRATAAYYGMVEAVDGHYGTVLDALREAGEDLDEWVIIYTSDHGEMLGEHGVWEKQKFFEGSVRVPLIVRYPQRFSPKRVRENVNLCDLFAILCDLTGTPKPAGLDSRSLVRLLAGDRDEWHHRFHDETVSQFGGTNLMIKRGSLKYQSYDREGCAAEPEVLFDLETDPAERTNLIDTTRYADAVSDFRRRRASLGFGPDRDLHYTDAGYAQSGSSNG